MRRLVLLAAVALVFPTTGCRKRPAGPLSPPDGRYTVTVPAGKARHYETDEYGLRLTMDGVENRNGAYCVGYADIPPGTPCDLDGAVDGIAQRAGGSNLRSDGASNHAGHESTGWREFEVDSVRPKGFVSGRVIYARGRLYMVLALGTDYRLSKPEVRAFIDSFRLTDGDTPGAARAAGDTFPGVAAGGGAPAARPEPPPFPPPVVPTPPKPQGPKIFGGAFDPEFEDVAPAGGLLVGLDVSLTTFINYDIIGTVRPVFRVGDKEEVGQVHGTDTKRGRRYAAKAGYAVGAIDVKAGLGVDGFRLTFMRVVGNRLDPNDSYQSEWIGGPGGHEQGRHGGDGTPVIGIVGKQNDKNVSGIGLVLK